MTATGKNTVYLKEVKGIIQTNGEYNSTGQLSLYRRNVSNTNLVNKSATIPNSTANQNWTIGDFVSTNIYTPIPPTAVQCLDSSNAPVTIANSVKSQSTCVNHPTLAASEYYSNNYVSTPVPVNNRSIESGSGSERFILTYDGSLTGSNADANWRIEVTDIEIYLGNDQDAASVINVANYESVGLLPFVISK